MPNPSHISENVYVIWGIPGPCLWFGTHVKLWTKKMASPWVVHASLSLVTWKNRDNLMPRYQRCVFVYSTLLALLLPTLPSSDTCLESPYWSGSFVSIGLFLQTSPPVYGPLESWLNTSTLKMETALFLKYWLLPAFPHGDLTQKNIIRNSWLWLYLAGAQWLHGLGWSSMRTWSMSLSYSYA
jgi:hypothetical protein